jgi:hypothetical protein
VQGQICLYESENDSFSSFEDAGALVTVTDTMGHFDLRSFEWHADHFNVDIMECPDVFPLGNKFVILASLQGLLQPAHKRSHTLSRMWHIVSILMERS